MASAVGGVPCFIREIYYAPSCPEHVAQLFEVALVQHNSGAFSAAVSSFLGAQKKWEEIILKEQFPELEDTQADSILAQLIAKEEKEKRLKRDAERRRQREAATEEKEKDDAEAAPSENGEDEEEEIVAKRRQEEEDAEDKRRRRALAIHQCYEKIPVEGKIFIRLSISSVLESAGDDERALAECLTALKLCQTISTVYTMHPITATVYSALGTIYGHLSQFDFAADYFFRALEIREQVLGADHVDVALLMNNIGVVLHLLDRPFDAMPILYKAEAVFKSQFPPTHPRLQIVCENIRKTKKVFLKDSELPPVPYTPITPPVIPGARRAKAIVEGKVKKPKKEKKDKKK